MQDGTSGKMQKATRNHSNLRGPAKAASLIAVCCFSLCIAVLADAAERRIEPEFRAGYETDNNAALNSAGEVAEIQGVILDTSARVQFSSPTTSVAIIPRLRARRYDREAYDSDDAFLRLIWNSERPTLRFTLRSDYARESIRSAERADVDPGDGAEDIPGDEIGEISAFGDRERISVTPLWEFDLSQRNRVSTEINYNDVDYLDVVGRTYYPYSDLRVNLTFSRSFAERIRAFVTGTGRKYEGRDTTGENTGSANGSGLYLGVDWQLSQSTLFTAAIGPEETRPELEENTKSTIWNAGIEKRLETVSFLAQIQSTVGAGGGGGVSERYSLDFSMRKQMSSRWNFGIGVRAYTLNQLYDLPDAIDDREYVQARFQMEYALSRNLTAELVFRHANLKRDSFVEARESDNINLWITYRPTAMTRSR